MIIFPIELFYVQIYTTALRYMYVIVLAVMVSINLPCSFIECELLLHINVIMSVRKHVSCAYASIILSVFL